MNQNQVTKPLILCADHFYLSDKALKKLSEAGILVWSKTSKEEDIIREAKEATVIASEYGQITSRIIDQAPRLKAISVWGVGYDHVDIEAASNRGISVTNCRGANSESVAEHAFAMLLALSRRVLELDNFVRKGNWKTQQEVGLGPAMIPHDLYGKTIGIIGFGEIGSRVARIARGFNMHIVAYDPYVSQERLREFDATSLPLESLLKTSDFVAINTILSPETRGMIGEAQLALMKATTILVNVSRGAVVDQAALVTALQTKKIAGAGLDVFMKEPVDLNDALSQLENVVLSPHIAGGSQEALDSTSMALAEEICRVLDGEAPRNLVNRAQLQKRGFL